MRKSRACRGFEIEYRNILDERKVLESNMMCKIMMNTGSRLTDLLDIHLSYQHVMWRNCHAAPQRRGKKAIIYRIALPTTQQQTTK